MALYGVPFSTNIEIYDVSIEHFLIVALFAWFGRLSEKNRF